MENLIEIVEWIEKKDKGVKMTYNLTSEGEKVFRMLAKKNKQRFSYKFVNTQILNAIKRGMKRG